MEHDQIQQTPFPLSCSSAIDAEPISSNAGGVEEIENSTINYEVSIKVVFPDYSLIVEYGRY